MRRILFVSYSQPFLPYSGYTYRTVGILQWLSQHYHVDIVFEGTTEDVRNDYLSLERFGRIVAVAPESNLLTFAKGALGRLPFHHVRHSSPSMRTALRKMLATGEYDLVWLNKSVHFPLFGDLAFLPPIIIDQIAAEPCVWDNLIKSDPRVYVRLFSRWNKRKVMRYERMVYSKVAGTIAISPSDAEVMLMHFPGIRQIIVPQGVNTSYYAPFPQATPDPDLLLFSGGAAVRNVQAMHRLVTEIMPLVHSERPSMRLLWIGNIDRSEYGFLAKPWIEVSGFVEHVPPYFDKGMIYVSPFYMGEGMKTKIVEAMAMGKPIVATPIGLSGITGADEMPFIEVAESNEALASAILQMRARPDLMQLSSLARLCAIEHYSWDKVLEPLQPFLEASIKRA